MEFLGEMGGIEIDAAGMKNLLTLANLPALCKSISTITPEGERRGVMYCVWGEFEVTRDEIRYGVRFSLPGCPNALAWTVTVDEAARTALVHCTIDKQTHDADFIDSIRDFVSDWVQGLAAATRAGTPVIRFTDNARVQSSGAAL